MFVDWKNLKAKRRRLFTENIEKLSGKEKGEKKLKQKDWKESILKFRVKYYNFRIRILLNLKRKKIL